MYNIEQSQRMLRLRIKIDVWSKELGVPENERELGREKLMDAYMHLPPVRIWLYSKQLRRMFRSHRQDVLGVLGDYASSSLALDILCDKPEDIIAAGRVLKSCVCLLLERAMLTNIQRSAVLLQEKCLTASSTTQL